MKSPILKLRFRVLGMSALAAYSSVVFAYGGWWGWGDKVSQDAYALCEKNFPKNNQNESPAELEKACEYGNDYAHNSLYTPYEDSDNAIDADVPVVLPEIGDFRAAYIQGRQQCLDGYSGKSHMREKLACLDGYDLFAATLLLGVDYNSGKGPEQKFDDEYYRAHDYLNVYQDITGDSEWAYVLVHRVYYPEYYPAFRRDDMYIPPGTDQAVAGNGGTAAGFYGHNGNSNSAFWYYWMMNNRSYAGTDDRRSTFAYPARAGSYVSGGTPPAPPSYGPSASPRPYAATSAWYRSLPAAIPANQSWSTGTIRSMVGTATGRFSPTMTAPATVGIRSSTGMISGGGRSYGIARGCFGGGFSGGFSAGS